MNETLTLGPNKSGQFLILEVSAGDDAYFVDIAIRQNDEVCYQASLTMNSAQRISEFLADAYKTFGE